MSREWIMRYPLLDWHGNKGNRSGDDAASSRYTECRLAPISEDGLLANLKKDNVDFQMNYSEDEEEPVTLPALFPNLLCNPNKGIGEAIASDWTCHNLTDVGNLILEYLKNGNLDFSNMAPDYPTGGTIINKNELINIYTTGKGKVKIRGKYRIEEQKGTKLLVFYEIPYSVVIEDLIDDLKISLNMGNLPGVIDIREDSNTKEDRVVFEIENSVDPDHLAKIIYSISDLEKTLSVNQVALDTNLNPKLMNWQECIDIYVAHNIDVITREAKFDLKKIEDRLEIVNGLLKALEDIDNIIALIKGSESSSAAKEALKVKYGFSEPQAKAIVDMKLGRLAGLERVEIENEQKELKSEQDKLNTLLSSEANLKAELSTRLESFINKFGDERKTEVINLEVSNDISESVLP